MKKVLVIVAHPHMEQSVVNKRWVEELKLYPERFTAHELYKVYADGVIDVTKEQALVDAHDSVVFQFPVYWFNCTPLLKQWLDEVLTYGWAYGSTGNSLRGKRMGLAVSLGSQEENYVEPYTLTKMLLPFEMSMNYVGAIHQGVFAMYGANTEAEKSTLTTPKLEASAKDYVKFLTQFETTM